MARISLYLCLAGLASGLRLHESENRRSVAWTRDLFGFAEPQRSHGPYGYTRVQTYAASEIAPFWTFPTNDDFVLDSHGIQRKLRSHRLSSGEDLEMAGTDQESYVSERETPREVPTRPKHDKPGEWARGAVPGREVQLGFVPVQIYSQSRRYDSEEHLPRERALEEAEDREELIAAPRLREVLRNKKLHEVYEEEGYEDLGYDHGGYNHHGVKLEKAVKNEKGVYRKPPQPAPEEPPTEGAPASGAAEQQVESRIVNNIHPNPEESNKVTTSQPTSPELANRMDLTLGRSEEDGIESRVMNKQGRIIFPGEAARRQYTTLVSPIVVAPDVSFLATASVQSPQIVHQVATFEPSSYYYDTSPSSFTSTSPIQFASTLNTYASLINENISSPVLHTPLIVDVPEESYNTTNEYTLSRSDRNSQEKEYENHRATNNNTKRDSQKTNTESSSTPNPRTSGRRRGSSRGSSTYQSSVSEPKQFSASESTTSQPKTPNKKYSSTTPMKKSKIYSNLTRGSSKYSPEDDSQWTPSVGTQNIRHPSLPIDSEEGKGEDSPKLSREPPKTGNVASQVISVPDDVSTTKDPSANAKYVEQLTLAHFSAPVYVNPKQSQSASQDKRLSDLAKQLNSPQAEDEEPHSRRKKRNAAYHSKEKYPYYDSPKSISKDSPLKYASNSETIPKKTYGGMEFYESKENIRCDGPNPPKNITPEKEEDGEWEEDPMPEGERVRGVGNAIDCYKKKFFGRDPLDNPFFKEDKVYTESGSNEYSDREYNSEEIRNPPASVGSDSGIRKKIMFIENPDIFRNNTDSEGEKRSISSEEESEGSVESAEDGSIETRAPPRYSSNQYSVYESVERPKYKEENTRPRKINKKPEPTSTYVLKKKTKALPQYVMQPVSVYSIISNNDIPPHHAPLLIPENGPKFAPIPVRKENPGRYSSEQAKDAPIPKIYPPPPNYGEHTIVVTKREADPDLWSMINPFRWWWPNLFDSRRDEPRYKRSSEVVYDEPPEISDAPTESKAPTSSPISLAEFKVKFNISDSKQTPKKISTRLTGGFLNRNPDITDAIEDIIDKKPTEASTSSTIPTTTVKPKVIFPRAKIPRRKVKPPKKSGNIPEASTESATTTTSTTQAPSTTTRMYKPKRVIPKTFGRGPFNAFTVLTTSKEVAPTAPFDRRFLQEEDLIRRKQEEEATKRKQEEDAMKRKQEEDSAKRKQEEEDLAGKKQEEEESKASSEDSTTAGSNMVSPPERLGENQTLTYVVDPVSGVGSWGEQRRWKPKRKRPTTPSVYSYGNATFRGAAARKHQRDVPDPAKGLTSLAKDGARRAAAASPTPELQVVRFTTVRTNKPPPKYILEPDKRRYYYAKV